MSVQSSLLLLIKSNFKAAAILLMGCCFLCLDASAQADNRYCDPGNQPKFGAKDGPATLPQSCFYTALSATPSPGKKIKVTAEESLQQAIDSAGCGDTLELPAGAKFTGFFSFPTKNCDDSHWITVRSSGELPPEGVRITPCYAGVSSLPGRPEYPCTAPRKVMAALILPAQGSIKVTDHYRFIGVEFSRTPGSGLVSNTITANRADKIILDRTWVHGTELDETTRGIAIPGATNIAVIDSYFSDFHCIARTGACVDSQAIWGGVGDIGGGTLKIVDNYLEAAGENIMMGGGGGSKTPADLEIRRNDFYKPISWHTAPGPRFIVKNNFELKNAARVLIEGNTFENSWGGFSQVGFQVLITPKNQNNQCPLCIVQDVTLRYCFMRHSGAGIQLASTASDSGGLTQGLENVSIHDVVMDDINARKFDGNGMTFQISTSGGAFRNFSIRHVTVPFSDRQLFSIGGRMHAAQEVVINDNIFDAGQYQVTSTGGQRNCAFQQVSPKDIFEACWLPYQVSGNVFIGSLGGWPKGNRSVRNAQSIGISASPNKENELRDFKPRESSEPGTDGKPVGADIDAIQTVLAGRDLSAITGASKN